MIAAKHQKNILKKQQILEVAERLLIDNYQDIVIGDLAKEVDMAKGTLYKYFKSKNALYLELLILNEKRLLDISLNYNKDLKIFLSKFMLYHLQNSNRTIKFHTIEEQVTSQERNLNSLFDELYAIREKRIIEMRDITMEHLKRVGSVFSVRDYFSYIWSITYGVALFVSSNCYKQSVLDKNKLINFYIDQVINI
ncbi:TetR/AcrR family transcriptional regulator [Acinetobacter tibetensis]|uniref:TetR/AcrR family transcriptional regulator n=1 Tax=Acinetobacter tibetensis TaxID=2943497 RepID=UPI003A4E5E70